MNAGIAVNFPVRILSIFKLRLCSLLSFGFITVSLQILLIKENKLNFTIGNTLCQGTHVFL